MLSKKEMMNVKNLSLALKDLKEKKKVVAAFKIVEENGNEESDDKGYFLMEDGTSYGTISTTVIKQIDDINELLADGEDVYVEVITRQSKKDRDFISLVIS